MQKTAFNIIGGQEYIAKQIKKHLAILHDLEKSEINFLDMCLPDVLLMVQNCWSQISNKYYNCDGVANLNINNSNQYAQLLLILANHISVEENTSLADKIFGLNKMLNSCDIYHEVTLPKSFYIDHTLGIVVGRAHLGERLYISQNCTIGSNPGQLDYPTLGKDNYLMANATLVGSVKTGDRVIFAAGSFTKDIEVPSDSIVFGRAPNNVIKNLKADSFRKASPFIILD